MLKTIAKTAQSELKIHRSRFMTSLLYVEDQVEIKNLLAAHREQFRDATHNCFAYVCGAAQEQQYYSDQGEPSGTAGKPILNALLRHGLTNVLAIVTRYYGGVKLGVRGLIDAYTAVTEQAISEADLIDFRPVRTVLVQCSYDFWETLRHIMNQLDGGIKALEYTDQVTAELTYPLDKLDDVQKVLDELALKNQIIIKE